MTDTSGVSRPSFGVGKIAGDSFSIFFRHFIWILLISLLPVIALGVFGLVSVTVFSAGSNSPGVMTIVMVILFVLLVAASLGAVQATPQPEEASARAAKGEAVRDSDI